MAIPTDGGGGSNFDLEVDSLRTAVTKLTQLSDRVSTLKGDFESYKGSVTPSDWSAEAACQSFGTSYTAALDVYAQVIAGMETDVTNYRNALQAALSDYTTADDDALARMNTAFAALDDKPLAADEQGQHQYETPTDHGALQSANPSQPTDTSPTVPGNNGASSNGAPGNGAPNNASAGTSSPPPPPSTQPTPVQR